MRRTALEQPDAAALRAINATARKFVTFYRDHMGEFPRDTTGGVVRDTDQVGPPQFTQSSSPGL